MQPLWRVYLLGKLSVAGAEQEHTRFETQRAAALLAYLALYINRDHPRNDLTERIWPDAPFEAGANRLRNALSSLRRMLEPPGVQAGTVLIADRRYVRLNPDAVWVDASEFDRLLRLASRAEGSRRTELLKDATQLYNGELAPGLLDSWVFIDRERLADGYAAAECHLSSIYEAEGETCRAIDVAHRAVSMLPLHEEANRKLLRLYALNGREQDALRHAAAYESRLRDEFGEELLDEDRRLVATVRERVSPKSLNTSALVHARVAPTPPTDDVVEDVAPLSTAITVDETAPSYSPAMAQFTRFFGREVEIAWLQGQLAGKEPGSPGRLITITGPGGAGKTRLIIENLSRVSSRFSFIPLAALDDPEHLLNAICEGLNVKQPSSGDLAQFVADQLVLQTDLLVLDNMEHLLPAGADTLAWLRTRAPRLDVIVTSRQRLGIAGEEELQLSPLPIPIVGQTPEELSQLDSVRLFLDRAQLSKPGFQITPRNADEIATICRKVDGLPLAIELVAAWVGSMPASALAERLEDPLPLLVSRRRDRPERHQSLMGAVEWSLRDMPESLREAFSQLGVFRGSFSLQAADRVLHIDNVFDALIELRDRSLLIPVSEANEPRFRMLEPIRECALALLAEQDREAVRLRHMQYYLSVAKDFEPQLQGPRQAELLDWFAREQENLRSALRWSIHSEPLLALGLAGCMWRYWHDRSQLVEGRKWLGSALDADKSGVPTLERSLAANGAGILAMAMGDLEVANERLSESLAIGEQIGDLRRVAVATNNLGNLALQPSDWEEAIRLYHRAIELWRQLGDRTWEGMTTTNLGMAYFGAGDMDNARKSYEESLSILRRLDAKNGIANALGNFSHLLERAGDFDEAEAYALAGIAIYDELGCDLLAATLYVGLGTISLAKSDAQSAMIHLLTALDAMVTAEDRRGIATTLIHVSEAYLLLNQPDRAAHIAGAVETYLSDHRENIAQKHLDAWEQLEKRLKEIATTRSAARARMQGRLADVSTIALEVLRSRRANQAAESYEEAPV
jgi:non-specific serine/threonine protein kinase